jgi:hypothetical protein
MTASPFADTPASPVDAAVAQVLFQNRFYTVKAHFDRDVLSSNGTPSASDKSTIEWRFPMAAVVQKPPELEATLSTTSFSWGLIIGGACCGALALGGGGAAVAAVLWSMSRKARPQ